MSRDDRHRLWEMIQIVAEINPWVPSSFPDRNRRWREGRIGERANRDTKMLRETIGLPIDCSAAFRTKIHLKFSALLPIPNVHFAGPLRSDFGSLEIRADTVWCAGSPLALLAMARGNECGLAGGFDPQ